MAQRLGDILLAQGAVDADKLAAALSDQKAFGGKLGRTLVDLGYVSELSLMAALAVQLELETVDLDTLQPTDEALSTLTVQLCERYGIFPVRFDPEQRILWLATAEPDHVALQEVAQTTQLTLEPVLAPMSQIERAVRKHYFGESPGEVKRRKGDAMTSIPRDSGARTAEKAPPGKLPSSANAVLRDPDSAPPEPEAAPAASEAESEVQSEAMQLEPTAIVPAEEPRPEHQPGPSQAAGPADTQESAPIGVAPEAAAPAEPPAEAAVPAEPEAPATASADTSFAAFAQLEPARMLRSITPAGGQPDAVEELQRVVVRMEKIISAQGRAFRALVEILQEKGVVRRGELGSRTTKKP